jgi:hypothetical protein
MVIIRVSFGHNGQKTNAKEVRWTTATHSSWLRTAIAGLPFCFQPFSFLSCLLPLLYSIYISFSDLAHSFNTL